MRLAWEMLRLYIISCLKLKSNEINEQKLFFFFKLSSFGLDPGQDGRFLTYKTLSDEPCTRVPGDRRCVGGGHGSSVDEFVTLILGWGRQ